MDEVAPLFRRWYTSKQRRNKGSTIPESKSIRRIFAILNQPNAQKTTIFEKQTSLTFPHCIAESTTIMFIFPLMRVAHVLYMIRFIRTAQSDFGWLPQRLLTDQTLFCYSSVVTQWTNWTDQRLEKRREIVISSEGPASDYVQNRCLYLPRFNARQIERTL